MSRSVSTSNPKIKIKSVGTYNPNDPSDHQNIFKEKKSHEKYENPSAQRQTNTFQYIYPANTKNNYYPNVGSNKKHQDNQNQDRRPTSGINTFPRQSQIVQQSMQPQCAPQTQSRSLSSNKKIVIKDVSSNYYQLGQPDKQKQQEQQELKKFKIQLPLTQRYEQQHNKEEILKSPNQHIQSYTQRSVSEYEQNNSNLFKTTIQIKQQCQQTKEQEQKHIKLLVEQKGHSQLQQQSQVKPQEQKYNNELIEQNEENHSRLQSVILKCNYCDINSVSEFNFLPCLHQFHSDCLKLLIEKQLKKQTAKIRCMCNKKIPQIYWVKYLTPDNLKMFYQIQVKQLTKKYHKYAWKTCSNQHCCFLFIEDPFVQRVEKCPECLHQTRRISFQNK